MATIYSRSRGRAGMTLIEILVVIAIIAILAALILAGVMGAYSKGYEALARSDMLNLSAALDRFKAEKKFYPPSKLKLHSKYSDYNPANPLDIESLAYLAAMFPNIAWNTNPNQVINWAGATTIPAGGFTLDGDQCLVFFLGGPPAGGGALTAGAQMALLGGFSTNPSDPAYYPTPAGGKTLDRKRYYEFPANRLYLREANNPFPSFQDAWPSQGAARPASPYVYFSAGKTQNGYDSTQVITFTIPIKGAPKAVSVSPYVQALATAATPVKYYNPTTFQIITAGLDGRFGPGGTAPTAFPPMALPTGWVPATDGPSPGMDDFSNFWDKQLGSN